MNVKKININQLEPTYGIESNAYDITYEETNVGEKLSELVDKTSGITKESIDSDDESIEFYDKGIIIHKIDKDNANFKNLKSNGKDVITSGKINSTSNVEEVVIRNNDNTENYVSFGTYGLKAKNFPAYESLSMFVENAIFIGDSVTQGIISDYPRLVESAKVGFSYPEKISKMMNWNIVNAGRGGYTAERWYNEEITKYDYSQYQLSVIEFCYNQDYTDTISTDVEPYADYHDFAETQTGCLCKIIEAIKSANEKIFIVMVISPKILDWYGINSGRYVVYKKIAKRYNIPIIDLTDISYTNLNDERFHGLSVQGTIDLTHFNAIGYTAKASVIKRELDQIFFNYSKVINNTIF